MARVKGAMMTRKRRKKILKRAKGYFGAKSTHFRTANQAVMKSLKYAYIGRKHKKRDFRRLWITRISAACKLNGMNYSRFMNGLKKAGIEINRKMLADLAVSDAAAFTALTEKAKAALYVFANSKAHGNLPCAFCLFGVDPDKMIVIARHWCYNSRCTADFLPKT